MTTLTYSTTANEQTRRGAMHLLWALGAGVIGFGVTALFSGLLMLPRGWFVLVYALIGGGYAAAYFRWSQVEPGTWLRHNRTWGLIAAALVGAFTVNNILSQPASAHTEGARLVFDIAWLGIVYGTLDAVLLSVLPVYAVRQALAGWTRSWPGKIAVAALAILASLAVTAAYHLGYPEFRGPGLVAPVFGNGVMSLGYVLANNPIAAVFSHVAMHIAGVLHGPASVVQLPPHY